MHLALFAALLLVPALLLSGYLIREAASERRHEAELRVIQLASDLADDLSSEFELSLTILRTLSISQALTRDDLKAFYAQAKEALHTQDAAIMLVEPGGRQLLNTALPWDAPRPNYSDPKVLAQVVESRKASLTDLLPGQLPNRHAIDLLLPVIEGGVVTRVLVYSVAAEHVRDIIEGQDLGGDWTTAVVDRNGRVVARYLAHKQYVGRPLNSGIYSAGGKPRTAQSVTDIDGRPVVQAMTYTRVGPWAVIASVSESYLSQVVRDARMNLIIGTAAILGLATLLVLFYGRQLSRALDGMSSAVEGHPRETIIREATAAAKALSAAAGKLRQSEEQFRGIYLNAATGIAIQSPEGRFEACNPAYARLLGYAEGELQKITPLDLVHPQDRAENSRLLEDLLTGRRSSVEIEHRYVDAGQRTIWVHKHVSVMRDVDGTPLHVIALVSDRSERLKHEQELAIAVERSRIAQLSAKAALYDVVPRTGQAQFNAAFTAVSGFTLSEISAPSDARLALVHPEDRASVLAAIEAGIASGSGYDIVYRLRHKDGHYIWIQDRASILTGTHDGDARIIGMMLDITAAKAREEHVNLLLREVNHRSKNMLGLVQAIARQTATPDAGTFLSDFSERIQALSANQDLLVSNDWSGVAIDALVATQLAHFAGVSAQRITTEGPSVRLSPAVAQVLGMALHELATNASKYGALSNDEGRITVRWSVQDGQFAISWQEENGPDVVEPSRAGFGTTVLKAMTAMSLDADVTLSYPRAGLRWSLVCPIAEVLELTPASARSTASGRTPPRQKRRSRILVVEDEALIAMEIADILMAEDYEVVGPARTVEQALALFQEYGCDMGVLDVNLGAQTAEPIARELGEQSIPFILVSGYDRDQQPRALRAAPLVKKPIRPDVLIAEIRKRLAATAA